jgi:hypothetical protein
MRLLTRMHRRPLLVAVIAAFVVGCNDGSGAPAAPTPAPTPAPSAPPVPAPSPAPAPPSAEPVAVSLIELDPQEISGQSQSVATVTLTGPAPEGGALVGIATSNRDVAKVPATLLIPAGERTGNFRVESSTVADVTRVAIVASYGGVSNGATLTVGFDPLSAAFVVPGSCSLLSSGRLTCSFDGSASKGRISAFRWSIRTTRRGLYEWESNSPVTTPSGTDCVFFSGLGSPPGNPNSFTIEVGLQVTGRNGERSNLATQFVTVFASRVCGYP